ncbi:MAG TPA: tetratricopeptide repeat protein [Gemmatimonadaceae bacterium]|nr:tetratricopeptide repeat protein [Gemmatimonadaceae bacterium]
MKRIVARQACLALVAAIALSCVGWPADAQTGAGADASFRAGKYDEAIAAYRAGAAGPDAPATAARGLVRALATVGRYDDAEQTARSATAGGSPELWNVLGEVLAERGKLAEAESAFVSAIRGRATDSLTARLNLAILRFERGERDEAMREFDHFIDVYNRGARLTAEELMAVGTACRYLGLERHEMVRDALKAYDLAIAAAPEWLEPRVRVGELFLEKYNGTDARASFGEVLEVNASHPRALVGMARLLLFENASGADDLVRKALGVNERYVPARLVLAGMAAANEDYEAATREARTALDVNPASIEALAVLGASRLLSGDRTGFENARRRALERNPRSAEFHATVADLSARSRLYREAAELAREAVRVDSMSWRAHSVLGMNQLRLGAITDGQRSLERAFAGDPYDVWVKNTLDLLDTFDGYEEVRTERFLIVAERKEAALMGLYAGELAEEAFARLQARYGYRPAGPVRIELYRSHADFSVRTVGLTGLGALGVAFGDVVALDSPSARELGHFNWGSVLWHELAHTFTLGASANRVPRWFSEGLSVLEERRARPGWGDDVTPGFLIAHRDGRLPAASRLNEAFTRPTYPEQIGHAYYMASLVCEMIERDGGIEAIRAMLGGFRDGQTTAAIFRQVLRTDLERFDRRFDEYVRQRFARAMTALGPGESGGPAGDGRAADGRRNALRAMANAGPYAAAMAEGGDHASAGRHEEAIAAFERAKAMFPEYAGEGSSYRALAAVHKTRRVVRRAASELQALTDIDGANHGALMELAAMLEQLGDSSGAAAALDRAIYLNPFEIPVHERLATLYAATGDRAKAVRERRAVLALDPVDRPAALFELALAHWQAGDAAAARREVLRALELAPNFERAQELLLTIRRGGAARVEAR